MGMSASQARFLQLTGRKVNIEYMGQQINQQRLALANQSAGLFEEMLTLEPPTPPSSLDDKYYSQGYTFTDKYDSDGNPAFRNDGISKKISWAKPVGVDDSPPPANTAFTITYTGGAVNPSTATVQWQDLADFADGEDNMITGGALKGIQMDGDLATLIWNIGATPLEETKKVILRAVTLEHGVYDPDGNYQTFQETVPAMLEFDNLNRLINMRIIEDMNNTANLDGNFLPGSAQGVGAFQTPFMSGGTDYIVGQGEALTYSGVFDETAFNDDMNKYEYEKATYDYEIERINLETAKIQKQDKSLELKMKQLDTEHKAISTEMDAVSKVIQKNIDSSFKTFG